MTFYYTDLPEGFLENLDPKTAYHLELMMAAIAEKSYRRGFQQGHYCCDHNHHLREKLIDWRFNDNLDESPAPDQDLTEPSAVRLRIECGGWLDYAFGSLWDRAHRQKLPMPTPN